MDLSRFAIHTHCSSGWFSIRRKGKHRSLAGQQPLHSSESLLRKRLGRGCARRARRSCFCCLFVCFIDCCCVSAWGGRCVCACVCVSLTPIGRHRRASHQPEASRQPPTHSDAPKQKIQIHFLRNPGRSTSPIPAEVFNTRSDNRCFCCCCWQRRAVLGD